MLYRHVVALNMTTLLFKGARKLYTLHVHVSMWYFVCVGGGTFRSAFAFLPIRLRYAESSHFLPHFL